MPGIDASIPLGIKPPDQMQGLSSLLTVANGTQTFKQNQQKTQQGAIDLQERQGMQQFLSDPKNITDDSGNLDLGKMQAGISQYAPTTGFKYMQNAADAYKAHTEATKALLSLDTEKRTQIAGTLASLPDDAPPDLVYKAVDALNANNQGLLTPMVNIFKPAYAHALATGGQAAATAFRQQAARGVLPQPTQQDMSTPSGVVVSDNQSSKVVSQKPGTIVPPGQALPGTTVQMQLPPTTPVVGPNNQPGYLGPQPSPGGQPAPAGPSYPTEKSMAGAVNGGVGATAADYDREIAQSAEGLAHVPDAASRQALQAHIAEMQRQKAAYFGGGQAASAPFVASAAVPGANESKAGSIAVVNDHWNALNKQAENSQMLESVIQNIKTLAPKAITGTLAGRTSFVNGLLNSLHLGDKITGDLQKDTDLLEKNMAQLNLGTPAATDAVRTIVGAARPHGTMQNGAIEEASDQLLGQIRANRAVRNALTIPKQILDQSGDASAYTQTRQHMEELADPRIFQYESLPPGKARAAFLAKQPDAASLVKKTQALVQMGAVQ